MKISVSSTTLSDNGLLTPVNPFPPVDIDDFFELELFRASKTTFVPFEEIEIEWSIRTIDPDTEFSNYTFSLIATDTVLADDLDASGTLSFSPHKNTLLRIQGQRRGRGGRATLGQTVALSVDESSCLIESIYARQIDYEVKDRLSNLTSETAELRLRTQFIPVSKDISPLGFVARKMEVIPTWNVGSIEYYFPLEIVINNFFNADLDVNLELTFSVDHRNSETELDVTIDHSSDADFDADENILSFGSAVAVAKTIDELLPLILDCKLREIERTIIGMILEYLGRHLDTHRLLSVRIVVSSQSLTRLDFVLCPFPVEPEPIVPDAPDDDGLAPLHG